MKRIAVGQLLQETNSLNPLTTDLADFEVYGLAQGDEVMDRYGEVCELAGFAKLPEILGEDIQWVGLIRALAWHGGPLRTGLTEEIVERILGGLHAAEVDGVILSLHGAQAGVDQPDVSGRVLEAIRGAVGDDIPIVASLDLHANLTQRMASNADVLVGYHTFPHVDQVECGQRAAKVLATLLQTGSRPQVSVWKIPMIVNTDGRTTDRGVLSDLWKRIVAAEQASDVFSVGLYMAQPWFDVPNLGWTLYQAYLGERAPLDPEAVSRTCWDTRFHKETTFLKPEQVVPAAMEINGGPVAVSESHDSTNSGAPGDSTLLLKALVKSRIPEGGALCFCVDAAAVEACLKAGEGSRIELEIGGRYDPYCRPLKLAVQVLKLGRIAYVLSGHGGHNMPVDMGNASVVRVNDVTLVLTEKTGPGSSPRLYETLGLDPKHFKIVIAKSPEGFRQDYEPFAAGILYCGAPGCAAPDLETVTFKQVDRPLFPLDPLEDPSEATWAGEMMKGKS